MNIGAKYCAGFIMDHYLVAILIEESKTKYEPIYKEYYSKDGTDNDTDYKTSVLAFSLLDHSVQETEIEMSSFDYEADRLLKYDGNKIIVSAGYSTFKLACITVESFKRKSLISKTCL